MDQTLLGEQLGISAEDAAFLQQVLGEVSGSATTSEVTDLTAADSDLSVITADTGPVTIDIASVVAEANTDPIMNKVMEDNSENTSRFSDAIWYNKIREQTVILGGLGGISSWTALMLSRTHPASIFVYDDDTVETVNLSGQMFGTSDVGQLKTNAITRIMRNYSDYGDVFAVPERFTELSEPGNIMICGFDSMASRKIFFNRWRDHVMGFSDIADRAKCLFIDGRLAAESFQIFCIKGDDHISMEKYENDWLFSDEEAEETTCSYKQTSFCANMIASVMVNCFVNFIANQCNPLVPRDVPFFTEYDASMMFFKTES